MESRPSHALCPPPSTAPSPTLAPVLWPLLPAQGCWLAVAPLASTGRCGPGPAAPQQRGAAPFIAVSSVSGLSCYRAPCAVTEGMKEGRQISCSPNSEASPAGFLPSFLGFWEDNMRAALLTSCSTGIRALVPLRWEGILAPGSSARAQPGPAAPWL